VVAKSPSKSLIKLRKKYAKTFSSPLTPGGPLPYTRKNLTSCNKSANKPSTSCVRATCPKLPTSLEQAVTDIIRLVARLFQQVRYSHDITILLQPCVVNLVTFLFIMTVLDLLEQSCNKSDNAIKLAVNNLLQQLGTSSAKTTW
jgi:hypothetical protein